MADQLTITLTGKPPVKINKDAWTVLAAAEYEDNHGAECSSQANRRDYYSLKVRQHGDGRFIVYAVYRHDTIHQGEKDRMVRGGALYSKSDDVVNGILTVAREMAERCDGDKTWERLELECIADMPAVEV